MLRLVLPVLLAVFTLIGGCAPARSSAQANAGPVRYVALGASDAVGVGARDPERESWVARFHTQLPAGSSLINLGVSGSKLSQALDQQLPVALGSAPDVVTIWLAVNDVSDRMPLEHYAADLEMLLAQLEQTGAVVLIGNVPDLSLLPAYQSQNRALPAGQIAAWNTVIADSAGRHGAVLVDLSALWHDQAEHPEYVSADGFHPSSEGYARLADVFWQALVASGGPRSDRG